MLKIGLLSDTHAWWDDKYAEYFADCDEIWHAEILVRKRLPINYQH